MAAVKVATIKYSVKTPSVSSSGSGPLWDVWPHLLTSLPDAAAREKALADANEVHQRCLEWEAKCAAAKATS